MSTINRTGTFRFGIVDAGIGETRNKYPQWIAQLQAVEYYDEDTEQWIDWSEYDEREITCYSVLFGGDGNPTLNAKQLQKALGWSGASLEELEHEHVADVIFQGRVEENTYEGTTRLQVNWVDSYDAEPGRTLQKLDSDDVKKLNAKYAAKLRELSGGTKPKSVEKVSKEDAKAAAKAKVADRGERGKAAEAKAAKGKGTKPSGPPKPPQAPKPQSAKTEQCDKGQAWIDCCKERGELVTDQQLETAWHAVVDNLGGEDAIEAGSKWGDVRDMVIEIVNKAAA